MSCANAWRSALGATSRVILNSPAWAPRSQLVGSCLDLA
jgi:hypothetical protein